MPVKKTAFVLAVSGLVALIVLPVIHSVNNLARRHAVIDRTLRTDGDPKTKSARFRCVSVF